MRHAETPCNLRSCFEVCISRLGASRYLPLLARSFRAARGAENSNVPADAKPNGKRSFQPFSHPASPDKLKTSQTANARISVQPRWSLTPVCSCIARDDGVVSRLNMLFIYPRGPKSWETLNTNQSHSWSLPLWHPNSVLRTARG